MKQRDLLFAGLLLLGAPAFAQDEPERTPKDAKVIFVQDFEADWDTWSTEEIGRIDVLEYYNHPGIHNGTDMAPWNDRAHWQRGLFRTDSLIILTNGVKVTDNAGEVANNNFPNEQFGTFEFPEGDDNQARIDAMRIFGEADLGGNYVLKYVSDTCTLAAQSWGTYKDGYTANYRRNLFVRGLDIEDNTSYRLTFYVKANRVPGHNRSESTPRMSAGVFRGYYQSEKPFSMGVQNDAAHYKYNTQFEYTKDDFNGDWEKVTYMTYYLNDSIANDFVFADGYWWAEGSEWKWAADAPGNTSGDSLYYIVQPDKFFVRLGFISDYTQFFVDNLSLTKSTIAGAEYYDDKLRVDFGYKTNLADLAKAAKAKTNIAAAEVTAEVPEDKVEELGYEYRFEVWGQLEDDSWEEVYIRSAEFHDDGYMYMFTEFYDEENAYQFDDYKQVLVTFHNPIDLEDLTLKYTGDGSNLSNAFPNALDTNWIKNGKIVPDFYNEIATPNPYVFEGVHSLADLPPVFQGAEIPNGSIFLTPQSSFSFKFSRDILCETFAPGVDLRNTDKAVATVNEVPWKVTFDNDSLTITCPDDSWKTMNGDYVIKLIQLKGKGTGYGENVTFSYNFGTPSRSVAAEATPIDISFTLVGEHTSVAKGVYTWSANNKTIGAGTPISTGNLNRMFTHDVEGSAIQRGYEVRPHGAGYGGHVYLGAGDPDYKIHLTPGGYKFKFKGTGWSWNGAATQPATVYVFSRVNDPTSVSSDNKMEIGVYTSTTPSDDGDLQNAEYAIPAANVDVVEYTFSLTEEDDYIIEFNNKAGAWSQGVFVGDFELGSIPSTVLYVNNLNEAVAKAKERAELAEVDPDLYYGVIFDALNDKIEYYDIDGAFDALLETSPAAWTGAVKELDDATNAMKLRMDTVDAFTKKLDEVVKKLSETEDYLVLPVYETLSALYDVALEYDITEKTGPEIYAFNTEMDNAIKALDARIALNSAFDAALSDAKTLVEAAAKTQYDEFGNLESCYDLYANDFEEYSVEDADIKDATAALIAATNSYKRIVQGAAVLPTRVKALSALAKELDPNQNDTEVAWNGALDELVAAEDFDNDELADIYKTAIKIALYDAAATNLADPTIDSIDITPFIKNYHLYTTASLGRTASSGTLDESKELNVYSIQTGWGNPPQFTDYAIATRNVEYTTTFPGWKFKSFGGQNYIGQEQVDWTASSHALVFDAWLASDWSSRAEISQELVDLPVGQYTLGAGISFNADAGKDTKFSAITNEATYEINASVNAGSAVAANTFIDSVMVGAEDTLTIKVEIPSHNSWVRVDNFYLAFRPVADFDYEGELAALEQKLGELMTIVDARQAVKDGVEYYTIGGIKLDAPKAGQILIRKTTQSNGKVVMDKVLIK